MPLSGEYEPSPIQFVREQVALYETSGGAQGAMLHGVPVVVLTTRGVKSGSLRKTPLMRVVHNGVYAVVASAAGANKHPSWYFNVIAEPRVELRDGDITYEFVARELSGAEREEWWSRAVGIYPVYADYQLKTERLFPVLLLAR
jgi:F420H(2)-dependent quinone reductase